MDKSNRDYSFLWNKLTDEEKFKLTRKDINELIEAFKANEKINTTSTYEVRWHDEPNLEPEETETEGTATEILRGYLQEFLQANVVKEPVIYVSKEFYLKIVKESFAWGVLLSPGGQVTFYGFPLFSVPGSGHPDYRIVDARMES